MPSSLCSRDWILLMLIPVAAALTACSGTKSVVDVQPTLAAVNAELENERAFLRLTDGRVLEARDVRVLPDTTHYRPPYTPNQRASPLYADEPSPRTKAQIPTDSLRAVATIVSTPAPFVGMGIGVIPGGVLLGKGLTIDCQGGTLACGLGRLFTIGVGAIATGAGAILGAIGGNLHDADRRVVYRGPVERYLPLPLLHRKDQ